MFMLVRELNRVVDIAVEAVNVTVLHVRRIVAAPAGQLRRLVQLSTADR